MKAIIKTALFLTCMLPFCSYADQDSFETKITEVLVNGANDSANSGTSCIFVSTPVDTACEHGAIAIQNNNKQLLASALTAKATNSTVWIYYDINIAPERSLHCPGRAMTSCSVISIGIR